jgi:urease accessory protein
MRIIRKHLRGANIAKALIRNAPTAVLLFDQRCRSRHKIELDNGESVALVLNQGTVLRHGDILVANDGKFVVVQAAMESVLRVTADSALQLTRAAYHLGNRHILVEIGPGYLQLEYDPVLVDMLRQLGGVTVKKVNEPFEPDAGAYGKGHKHGHDKTFAEDYALAQAAYAAHDKPGQHIHEHEHPHDDGHDHPHNREHRHDAHDHDHGVCQHHRHGHKPDHK